MGFEIRVPRFEPATCTQLTFKFVNNIITKILVYLNEGC